jgi:hypothetical protein
MGLKRSAAALTMLAIALLVSHGLVGAQGTYVDFEIVGKDGVAQMTFDRWRLVFEGIPCRSNRLPGKLFVFTDKMRSGSHRAPWGCVKQFTQEMNAQGNDIGLAGFRFKMLGRAEQLVFADQTYTRSARTQTIIIDREGKTRLSDKK